MEDDVDWDIRIRSQMIELAKAVRFLSDISETDSQLSPYGDDWDVIWPGHCREYIPSDDTPRYIVQNDQTVAPLSHIGWLKDLYDYPEHTRVYHRSVEPICTYAYAVSARGAQKILLQMGLFESNEPYKGHPNSAFDNNLSWMCEQKIMGMKCVSVTPPLFFSHRPAGSESRDSDIALNDGSNVREKGTTDVIVWSTRINAAHLIKGDKEHETRWS